MVRIFPGRWEGDTLVVESTNFRDDGWLDVNGAPLTSAATLIERFRRPNFGTLEIDITIDDPKAYTRPWTVRVNQRLLADTELIEFVCHENQKFDGAAAKSVLRRSTRETTAGAAADAAASRDPESAPPADRVSFRVMATRHVTPDTD